MPTLIAKEYKRFEDIKHIREDGSEFWSARELAPALDYTKWENFSKVIKRVSIPPRNPSSVRPLEIASPFCWKSTFR